MDNKLDTRWMLLEDGYPHTVLLTKEEAQAKLELHQLCFPDLKYSLAYDEYYEFSDINPNN